MVFLKQNVSKICFMRGEAFTVKCNLSDLYSNIEICTENSFGAYKFSPQIGGDGRLVTNTDVCDITDYGVLEENLYIQKQKGE